MVLLLDIWLIVREGWLIGVPIFAGAVWGKFYALEKRRSKWRSRVRKPRRRHTDASPGAESATTKTSSPSSTSESTP
jgi:hypothetical protein